MLVTHNIITKYTTKICYNVTTQNALKVSDISVH